MSDTEVVYVDEPVEGIGYEFQPPVDPDLGEGDHPVIPWLTQPRRRWIYGVVASLGAIAVVAGLATASTVMVTVAAVAAVLSTGLARANTPKL